MARLRLILGVVTLLIWLTSCKVTAIGVNLLRVKARAVDAVQQPIAGVQFRLGVCKVEPEAQPSVFRGPICTTDQRGFCAGEVVYRYDASSSNFGSFIDALLPKRKVPKRLFFVEAHSADRLLCRAELGSLSQMQLWGEEPIELKLRVEPGLSAEITVESPHAE